MQLQCNTSLKTVVWNLKWIYFIRGFNMVRSLNVEWMGVVLKLYVVRIWYAFVSMVWIWYKIVSMVWIWYKIIYMVWIWYKIVCMFWVLYVLVYDMVVVHSLYMIWKLYRFLYCTDMVWLVYMIWNGIWHVCGTLSLCGMNWSSKYSTCPPTPVISSPRTPIIILKEGAAH